MASSKSRSGRNSQTFLSGATLYDLEQEKLYQLSGEPSLLRKQRQVKESPRQDPKSPPPLYPAAHDIHDSWKQLSHSKPSLNTAEISYIDSLARRDDAGQQAPLNQKKSGKRITQGPKGNVAFVEDVEYEGESSSPSIESLYSSDSIHPSDSASGPILPTMTPQPQPQVSGSLQATRQTKEAMPDNSVCLQINPQNPQDVTILTEFDVTDDLEEDLEEYSRLVRMGRFRAAGRHFDNRLVHFIDNLYVVDQYCSALLAMSDFQALSRIAKEFAMELRPGIYRTNILTRFNQAEVLSGLEILSKEAKNKYSSYIAEYLETLAEIRNHWPELDSTELQVMMDSFSIEGGINHFRPRTCALVYRHLRAEGRIWDFKDLLDRLSQMESTSICTTLQSLLQEYGDDSENHLPKLLERIEEDWGSAADEVSSFALLEIFTTLTLASMSRQTSIPVVKIIFRIAQGHARDILRENPINSKTRPYLRWIVAKVLVEQYTDPKITGIFALASHLKRLPGKSWQPEVALPLSWMVLYAPYEDEDPKWHPDPSTTAGHDNALRTVLGVAEQLGDTPLQATCLQLLIYQCPQPRLLLDKLGDLWRSKGAYLGYIQTRMYCFIPESLSTPETRESIRRDILLAGEVSSGGPVSHARSMILRALSPGDPSHLEKNLYLGRAWEAISIPGYPDTGTQENNGRPNEGDVTRNVLAGPPTLSHPWAEPSDVAHPIQNQSPTGKAQGNQKSEHNHERLGSSVPLSRQDQNRAKAEHTTIRGSSETLYGISSPQPVKFPRPRLQKMHASEGRSNFPARSIPPLVPATNFPAHSHKGKGIARNVGGDESQPGRGKAESDEESKQAKPRNEAPERSDADKERDRERQKLSDRLSSVRIGD